jgi:DNA polymerase-3 subunit epsilon
MLGGESWQSREAVRHWRDAEFLVIDFETTGLRLRRARPLSVGWVPVVGGRARMQGAGYSLIRHSGDVPEETLRIHRILPEYVATAPPLPDVTAHLRAALAGRFLVAHAAVIDLAMLRRFGIRERARHVLDTADLARGLDRIEHRHDLSRLRLPELAARVGLPTHRPHHAFGDALTTAGIFLALATHLERHGNARVQDLLRLDGPIRSWGDDDRRVRIRAARTRRRATHRPPGVRPVSRARTARRQSFLGLSAGGSSPPDGASSLPDGASSPAAGASALPDDGLSTIPNSAAASSRCPPTCAATSMDLPG